MKAIFLQNSKNAFFINANTKAIMFAWTRAPEIIYIKQIDMSVVICGPFAFVTDG